MIEKIKHKIKMYFEKNLTVFPYAVEKCRSFFLAQTPEEALPALWHISQLVHILPDELVMEIIKVGWKSRDPKILEEIRYLVVHRWGETDGKMLLSLLEEIMVPEGEESIEKYLSDILHRAQEKDYMRVSCFVMGFGVGSVMLFALCAVCFIVGYICKLPFKLTVIIGYILAAFGVEAVLATLILHWKRKVVIKKWQLK